MGVPVRIDPDGSVEQLHRRECDGDGVRRVGRRRGAEQRRNLDGSELHGVERNAHRHVQHRERHGRLPRSGFGARLGFIDVGWQHDQIQDERHAVRAATGNERVDLRYGEGGKA